MAKSKDGDVVVSGEMSDLALDADKKEVAKPAMDASTAAKMLAKRVKVAVPVVAEIPMSTYGAKCKMLVEMAKKLIGVKETGGENRGPEVDQFLAAMGLDKGNPWCMSFVQYCARSVDRQYQEKNMDTIPVTLFPSGHVMTVWNQAPKSAKIVGEVHPGLLAIWQHYSNGIATDKGHVGIVSEVFGQNDVMTIEGNTGAGLRLVRDGDGVYEKRRVLGQMGTLRFKGFLRIWPAA